MALPLFWPSRYLFYPIGNTSAVSLTRDLAPETDATILMLGCGDPRNILYTIFCEHEDMDRSLDFTCCDIDPAVLARNVILLTLVADNQPGPAVIWNIFFHMRLDETSLAVLVSHCKKLIDISSTMKQWRSSAYSHFIRMCTEFTLTELRRHWSLYATMHGLPSQRIDGIHADFAERSKLARQNIPTAMASSARSAGPLMTKAMESCGQQFLEYWNDGGNFASPTEARNSTLLNPLFVYSLGGEGCSVHYGTNPVVSFHLASMLGNNRKNISVTDIVAAVQTEFAMWCSSFHASFSKQKTPVIRFFVGKATTVCHSLHAYATTGILTTGIPVAKWSTKLVTLDQHEYLGGGARTAFDVIDTSNLDDHIGSLNVIIAAVPLLPAFPQHFVLYTESLLFHDRDATKEFAESLKNDLSTFGLLVGICPVDYLAGFSSRSNVHELIMHDTMQKTSEAGQFHRVTTWKSPSSAHLDPRSGPKPALPIFDSQQLGTRLYDMYQQLFEKEEPSYFARQAADPSPGSLRRALAMSNIIWETRETFAVFLRLVRERLEIPQSRWSETMDRFVTLLQEQKESLGHLSRHDFYARAHFHGVHSASFLNVSVPKVGPMASWDQVPSLVRIIIVVPRQSLAMLDQISDSIPTPLLQCEFRGTGRRTLDIFSSVHAAFGTIIPTGTPARPSVLFNEDPLGQKGTSPLVASFVAVASLLTVDSVDNIEVSFAMRSTAGVSWALTKTFGSEFRLFSAKLMDKDHIYVLPEQPLPTAAPGWQPPAASTSQHNTAMYQLGTEGPLLVEMDEECELVSRLNFRITIENQRAKQLFGSGCKPVISQKSACVMQLAIGKKTQDIAFPFPVVGSQNVLRLARKSLYIEVVVPISGPFRSDGMKLNPFQVIGEGLSFVPWSFHLLNLSRSPILSTEAPGIKTWLKPHLAWMLSARERKLTRTHENDPLALIKDTINTIFHHASGISGGPVRRVFALQDKPSAECDTIIFIGAVRFDLSAHTLICDAYVLPLTPALMSKVGAEFGNLVREGNILNVGVYGDEMKAWKQLLPSFVERCRAWKHANNCEYRTQKMVPLGVEMHLDPLCSCGRAKDVDGMRKEKLWSPFAQSVTRIAISPLFALSYLEPVARDPDAGRCSVCRGKGKPKMKRCARCERVRYCSPGCQRKDWTTHKPKCKPI
ncbi:hypothetical protein C8R47DRAFT_982261 [Mycena vitilis]|nr:hypothetical protein C8R47DRAFT_982261 [Mycena vitilis]